MDEWMRAALLGAVQAATEFLPVSSSGHLVIGHRLLGEPANPLAFDRRQMQRFAGTHPPMEDRIARLRSGEWRQ